MAQIVVSCVSVVMTLRDTIDVTKMARGSAWQAIRILTPTALNASQLMAAVRYVHNSSEKAIILQCIIMLLKIICLPNASLFVQLQLVATAILLGPVCVMMAGLGTCVISASPQKDAVSVYSYFMSAGLGKGGGRGN